MKKYWRPGLRVWWRGDGEAQIGMDPPTILFGLTRADHLLLEGLARADPQLDCWSVAQRRGWARPDFDRFLERLPAHALVHAPTIYPTPAGRYWSVMAAIGAAPLATRRAEAKVIIDGMNSLGLQLADAVSSAGVNSLVLHDPHGVAPGDVSPRGYQASDIGHVRDRAAADRLRPHHPSTVLHVGIRSHPEPAHTAPTPDPGPAPARATGRASAAVFAPGLRGAHPGATAHIDAVASLAVVVAHGAIAPRRAQLYARAGTPTLPVVVRELDIMVGPLLSGTGPCLRCIHLSLTDDDPRWPVLATQLAAETSPGVDPAVATLAASLAAHQVIAIADGRPAAVVGVSLHVDGLHPVPRYRTWEPHPRCGCQLAHLTH